MKNSSKASDSAIYEERLFDDDNFTSVSCRMSPGSATTTVLKGIVYSSNEMNK